MSQYNPEWYKNYYEKNREKKIAQVSQHQKSSRSDRRSYEHERYEKIRDEVIEHYGGVCACCGETEKVFLQIDHINGNGNKHRKQIFQENSGHVPMTLWLKRNNFPEGFQVLCANCNVAKSKNGSCPHNLQRSQK